MREDPDVILVGELRDLETISVAITAAEMGILVMGTLHTNGAAPTVDRIVNSFPADKQSHIRTMLSTSLRGVISQQLLPTKHKPGRVAALEILVNTSAVANLIRQGKLDQLETAMQSGAAVGIKTAGNDHLTTCRNVLRCRYRRPTSRPETTSPSSSRSVTRSNGRHRGVSGTGRVMA
ncbi:MAG: ATPase, T2SS/T4P/T4SS family [Woeseiaceae bacterium]|nr:ATPase, T2SS/T4P/T4SS family [Woeseiaceae bacterium]